MISNVRKRAFGDIKAQVHTNTSGGRKMRITLNKVKPRLPENFEEDSWQKLEKAIVAVHEKHAVRYSHEELYNVVQNLCIHKLSSKLYKRLNVVMEAHICKMIQHLVDTTQESVAFLSRVNDTWSDHCQQMLTIRSIFLYLDRGYVKKETSVRSIWDLGLQVFRKYLEEQPQVEAKIVTGLLDQVERERKGETINRDVVKALMRMLTSLQLYTSKFEEVLLSNTEEFYRAESQERMDTSPVADYMKHVEKRLQEEVNRVSRYLDPATCKPLVTRVERRMIKAHVNMILEKGFDELMANMRNDDLGRMYSLFNRVDALEEMRAAFSTYVRRRGMEIVQDETHDKDMVQSLLDLKEKLDDLIDRSLMKNENFERTMRDSFEHFINCRENRPAQLIAKFMDMHLRSGNKAGEESKTGDVLDRAMVLFRFVNGKDVFQAFYKKDLAKRLLLGKSASTDTEMRVIGKLKSECGSQFTNKLESMFKDIDLSEEFMKQFNEREAASKAEANKMEINVHVLTTGCWPPYPRMESLVLPDIFLEKQKVFTEFYLSKYTGRRLSWQQPLNYCLLRAQLAGTKKEFSVSLFQTLVLLLFHGSTNETKLSYKDIATQTGIEDGELRRTMQSLACAKVRVLTKEPKGKDVEDGDVFLVNKEFKSNTFRVKINSIQMKETAKESKETHAKVFQDRQYQIDAAIVRIMKARKTLAHTMLISELFKQLKFPAKPVDLKKRIESLIDREYLERDQDEGHMYRYLA